MPPPVFHELMVVSCTRLRHDRSTQPQVVVMLLEYNQIPLFASPMLTLLHYGLSDLDTIAELQDKDQEPGLVFLYKLRPGSAPQSYGLQVMSL